MHLIEQRLIIDQAHQEHGSDTAYDPVNLPNMRPGKLGVHGGALDLGHP